MVDWGVVASIVAPIIALFVGVWVNRKFESRPNLISYYSDISAFTHTPEEGNPFNINTHSVVLRNAGKKSATNVRIRHSVLPDFNIWPQVQYEVEELPGGGAEIVIPNLVPGEEVTISYLYFPPVTAAEINAGIKSDEGFAQAIPVLLQQQYPTWFNVSAALLMLVGAVAVLYMIYVGVAHLLR